MSLQNPIQQTQDVDDQVLDFTQTKRREIVDKLTASGIPVTDNEQMSTLLKTLDGMDRVALGKKRIKADENIAGANQAAAAAVVAHLLQKAGNAGIAPFQSATLVDRVPPTLGADIPRPVLVEGEMDVVTPQLSYDTFIEQFRDDEAS